MESWLEGCQRKQPRIRCVGHPADQLSHEAPSSDLCVLSGEGVSHQNSVITTIIEAAYVAYQISCIQPALLTTHTDL